MSVLTLRNNFNNPAVLFGSGLLLVMLTLWVPFIPDWPTFIHMWRVELAASIFLLTSLFYIVLTDRPLLPAISREELVFIIFPVLAFIIWSTISISWSPSWKSAIHHTLIWAEYLIFYLIARRLIEKGKNYRTILTILTATFVIFSIPAIFDYCGYLIFGGSNRLGVRFAKYGEQVNTILPILIIWVLHLSKRRFVIGLTALALIWLLVFCSLGRINLFLFTAGTITVAATIFLFRRFHRYRRKMLVVLAVLIFAPISVHIFSLLSDDANVPMFRRMSDEAGISSSNNFRKLMATLSVEMFKDSPIIGIGADNFGMQVNNYRAVYGEQDPTDINLAAAESDIPERSHNEYLQILVELGIVGGLIFLWFLGGIALMAFNAYKKRASLVPLAAILGICLFLVSSLVSSYSFRFIQNGFIFFFVLAVASKYLLKSNETPAEKINISVNQLKMACAFGILVCVSLAAYSIIRVSSVYYMTQANYEQDIDQAIYLYNKATRLDDENPNAHFHFGHRLFNVGRFAEAATHLDRAIEMGQATSPTFSYLATSQFLSGNKSWAENTFERAVKLYPRSPFVLTRYAFFLNMNGNAADSALQLDRAIAIDRSAAETWWTLMNEGTQKASNDATRNNKLDLLMDLAPADAMYAVVKERELRFPLEKQKLPF